MAAEIMPMQPVVAIRQRRAARLRWAGVLLFCWLAGEPGAAAPDAETDQRTGTLVLETSLPELVGPEAAARMEAVFPPDERVRWQVFVPPAHDPSRPPGLMVYVSPTQSGRMPRGWKDVLEAHNLMWIAADRSGNRELVIRRVLLATLGVEAMQKRYRIDEARVYISGLSGGGKIASMIATDYPQLFRGAIYNCGVEVWDVDMPRYIEQMRQNRFVFVTGTYDQALEPTKRAYHAYLEAGIEHSKLMVIRNMTHRNPGRYDFAEALAFLDSDSSVAPSPVLEPE